MRTPALVLVAFLSLASPALAVPPVPSYSVTPDPPVAGEAASFLDTSTDLDAHAIAKVEWDFQNDGTWDTVQDPATVPPNAVAHTYPSAGSWSLRMRVTDANAEVAERVSLVQVAAPNASPVAQFAFSPSDPAVGEQVGFESFSFDTDGTITQAWDLDDDGDFDDGIGSTAATSSLSQGTHTVSLQVTDDDDAVSTVSRTVTVGAAPGNAAPVAQFAFSPSDPVVGDQVSFESFSFDTDGTITQAWDLDDDGDFDDGIGSTAATSSLSQGTHTVSLRVTDDDDAVSTVSRTVTVGPNAAPVAQFAFTPSNPVVGEQITFQSFSYDPDGSIQAQQWDVGNDGTFEGAGPTFATSSLPEGPTTVALRVTDNDGDPDTDTHTVTVGAAPPPPSGTDTGTATTTPPATVITTTTPPPAVTPPAEPSLMSPFPIVRIAGTVLRRGARVRTLEVRTSIGSRITVRCVGRSCPFARASRVAKQRLVRFRGMRGFLRAGVAVSISVRKTGQIGKYTRFVIRANRVPKRTDLCLMPGRSSPSECPES